MKNSFDGRRSLEPVLSEANATAQLPKMPRLGARLDEIADKAELIVHAAGRNADAAELNQLRLEGVERILALDSVVPGFLAKATKPGTLEVFRSKIANRYDSTEIIQRFFVVMQELRPLAVNLIQAPLL